MEKSLREEINKYLIAGVAVLIIVFAVILVYNDRQNKREFAQERAELQAGIMEEWGPRAGQQFAGALTPQPVAFPRPVSYRKIVDAISPSVVSINVDTGLVNRTQPAAQGRLAEGGIWPGSAKYVQQPPPNNAPAQAQAAALPQTQPGPGQAQQFQEMGKGGSGVIVNRRGYILTNHHVIHGASKITVTLFSGQLSKTYSAQIVDEAPSVDLAIIKILGTGNEVFIPARIGDSDKIFIGDEVLAVGSPFGLQQTVTFGIISNNKRTLTIRGRTFTDLIQTDAPINPGSSGGPLVNIRGEIVGINTAIYSPTQAFSGIGFAMPINLAVAAFPEFLEKTSGKSATPAFGVLHVAGRKTGAGGVWFGIEARTVDDVIRKHLNSPMSWGVVVTNISNTSLLEAGLQARDVIVRVNNRRIKNAEMLWSILGTKQSGDEIKLTVFRDGEKMHFYSRLTAAQSPWSAAQVALPGQAVAFPAPLTPETMQPPGLTGPLKGGEVGAGEVEALGMGVEDLAPELALAWKIAKGEKGVIVTEVAGPAKAAGLLPGDVIKCVNNQPIESMIGYMNAMNNANMKKGILLDVHRQGQRFYITLKG